MALTIVSVCPAEEPCSGRSETILTASPPPPVSPPPELPLAPLSSPPHPAARSARALSTRTSTDKRFLLLNCASSFARLFSRRCSWRATAVKGLARAEADSRQPGPLLLGRHYDAVRNVQQLCGYHSS